MQEEGKVIDDAALWKRNRELDIEDYEVPDDSEPFGFIDDGIESEKEERVITDRDVRSDSNALKLAQPTATLCVNVMDILLPAIVGHFAKVDKSEFKLDEDEKSTLTDAFAVYLKDKDWDLSPGAMLLVAIGSVYTPKLMYIAYLKKQRDEA